MTCQIEWGKYLSYEPETGRLFWKVCLNSRAPKGSEAGSAAGIRYRKFRFKGKFYQSHRVIWDMNYPENKLKPREEIDHVDHNRFNNRIENLRKVSHSTNSRNLSQAINNKSGVTGVHWYKAYGKWQAQICILGERVHLGYFSSKDEAIAARKAAEEKYGFHKNHGK